MKGRRKWLMAAIGAAVLLWGGYTWLYFLGTDGHGAMLVGESDFVRVVEMCGEKNYVCRGWSWVVPMIEMMESRFTPLLDYVAWNGILSVCIIIYLKWRKAKDWGRIKIFGWQLIAVVLVELWLLYSSLAAGGIEVGRLKLKEVVEPVAGVTTGSVELMGEIFGNLSDKECLVKVGWLGSGEGIWRMKNICMQASFVKRGLPMVAWVGLLVLEILVLGRATLQRFGFTGLRKLDEVVLSVGLGVVGWIAILWTVAVLGVFMPAVGWGLIVGIGAIFRRDMVYWIRTIFGWRVEIDLMRRENWPEMVTMFFLVSVLALNFLTVVRPIPIGWDDTVSYLNRPKMLVEYGKFIAPMSNPGWEYLTALGFLLFGTERGAGAAMMANWVAGVFAVGAIGVWVRRFSGRGWGVMAALLYYSMPMVGDFSFSDMKIENGVFAVGAISLYAAWLFLFTEWGRGRRGLLLLAGLLGGVAFSMKMTSLMGILGMIGVVVGVLLGGWAISGWGVVVLTGLARSGIEGVGEVFERVGWGRGPDVRVAVVLFALFLFSGWRKIKSRWKEGGAGIGWLFLGISVVVLVWVAHNNVGSGDRFLRLMWWPVERVGPELDIYGEKYGVSADRPRRSLPFELAVKKDHPACMPTGRKEELGRYTGYRGGWGDFLLLPWRAVMNLDITGVHVSTMPVLFILPFILVTAYFWQKRQRWLRWLMGWSGMVFGLWMFLGSGVWWYGLVMFLAWVVGLEMMVREGGGRFFRITVGVVVAGSLVLNMGVRLYELENKDVELLYLMGKVNEDQFVKGTFKNFQRAVEVIEERRRKFPDRPYIYVVGSPIAYFIPKSLEVVAESDLWLDRFNCLHQERDDKLTLNRLKALGINSIIFNTKTVTVEDDRSGTLHLKAREFVDFLNNDQLELKVEIYDEKDGFALVAVE